MILKTNELLASRPDRFTPEEDHGIHWIGSSVSFEGSLNALAKGKYLASSHYTEWAMQLCTDFSHNRNSPQSSHYTEWAM